MKELKRLITTTGIYFLGTVGTKLISFLLLPLYTAYIIPSQYGQYDVNINYALLFASICFLDIWTGIMKFMFEYKEKTAGKCCLCRTDDFFCFLCYLCYFHQPF